MNDPLITVSALVLGGLLWVLRALWVAHRNHTEKDAP